MEQNRKYKLHFSCIYLLYYLNINQKHDRNTTAENFQYSLKKKTKSGFYRLPTYRRGAHRKYFS